MGCQSPGVKQLRLGAYPRSPADGVAPANSALHGSPEHYAAFHWNRELMFTVITSAAQSVNTRPLLWMPSTVRGR